MGEILAILLTFLVHVAGAGVLVWSIMNKGDRDEMRDWWTDDDGGGPPVPTPPTKGSGPDGMPLPDAVPAPVRLRDGDRLGDRRGRPARRPAHPPRPVRTPDRARCAPPTASADGPPGHRLGRTSPADAPR